MAQSGWPGYKSTAHLARLLGFSFSFALVSSPRRGWTLVLPACPLCLYLCLCLYLPLPLPLLLPVPLPLLLPLPLPLAFTLLPWIRLVPFLSSSCPNHLILLPGAIYFPFENRRDIFIRWLVSFARSALSMIITFVSRSDVPIVSQAGDRSTHVFSTESTFESTIESWSCDQCVNGGRAIDRWFFLC